jgi:hypothetical protein
MIAGLPVVLAQQNQEMLARWVAKITSGSASGPRTRR